jgi:hypothetical protein
MRLRDAPPLNVTLDELASSPWVRDITGVSEVGVVDQRHAISLTRTVSLAV